MFAEIVRMLCQILRPWDQFVQSMMAVDRATTQSPSVHYYIRHYPDMPMFESWTHINIQRLNRQGLPLWYYLPQRIGPIPTAAELLQQVIDSIDAAPKYLAVITHKGQVLLAGADNIMVAGVAILGKANALLFGQLGHTDQNGDLITFELRFRLNGQLHCGHLLHDFLHHHGSLFSNLGWFIGSDDYSLGLTVFHQDHRVIGSAQ